MAGRGRKSADALAAPILPGRWLEPPDGLDPAEVAIWRAVTQALPGDWFDAGNSPLLRLYVSHVHSADLISKDIAGLRRELAEADAALQEERAKVPPDAKAINRASALRTQIINLVRQNLSAHGAQSNHIARLAQKLRLSLEVAILAAGRCRRRTKNEHAGTLVGLGKQPSRPIKKTRGRTPRAKDQTPSRQVAARSHSGAPAPYQEGEPMQSKPISLSDSEMTALLPAAQPLAVGDRDAFLRAVYAELSRQGELGPGVAYRTVRAEQRRFFRPPSGIKAGHKVSKWSRQRSPGSLTEAKPSILGMQTAAGFDLELGFDHVASITA